MINTIINLCEKLTEKEMKMVSDALSKVFERRIQSLIPELQTFTQDELVVTSNVISGLILTKENVPDIIEVYEQSKSTDLPNKISFGRMTKN
ncbi:hypothetical protein M3194_00140 [Paenibacillus glycanilyticus]|uniref:hypothetical protein n=1 Tax=Paenibacillus glycanilyticus TaxID=126569 RepID=UPI002040BBCF|nr:hypothetical protein [Paenibacillus glycanilyticus]MCM3625768.1 hypothetical protein [Paenibacillus glycanilyticus]